MTSISAMRWCHRCRSRNAAQEPVLTASCAILRSVSGRSLPERPADPPNLGRRFFGDIAARHGRTCARWRRDRTAPRGSSVENGSRRRRGVPPSETGRGDAGGVPRGIFRGRAKALRKVSRAVARTARSFIASERRASNMAATVASQRRTSRSHVATNTTVATGDGSASGYRASGRSRALATRCSQSATKDRRSFRKLPSRDASSRSSRRGTMTNSSSRPWMPETGVIANALVHVPPEREHLERMRRREPHVLRWARERLLRLGPAGLLLAHGSGRGARRRRRGRPGSNRRLGRLLWVSQFSVAASRVAGLPPGRRPSTGRRRSRADSATQRTQRGNIGGSRASVERRAQPSEAAALGRPRSRRRARPGGPTWDNREAGRPHKPTCWAPGPSPRTAATRSSTRRSGAARRSSKTPTRASSKRSPTMRATDCRCCRT
mmetsp:Transcript_14415/g.44525  ORF Transcript_14415/g.44525 Transcript_14415/m.44525 type:complete len:436 (-) Transcript_14415:178-1485(-)